MGRNEKRDLIGAGDVRAQTGQAFKNLKLILEAAGSNMHKVGKATAAIANLDYRPIVQEVCARLLGGRAPASQYGSRSRQFSGAGMACRN